MRNGEQHDDADAFTVGFSLWNVVLVLFPTFLSAGVQVYGYIRGIESLKSLWIVIVGAFSTFLILFFSHLIAIEIMAKVKDFKRKNELSIRELELRRNLAEVRLKAEKAMAFDYKMYASIESESVSAILRHCSWNLDKLHNKEVKHIDVRDANYISLETLLDGGTVYGSSFQCLPVRKLLLKQILNHRLTTLLCY